MASDSKAYDLVVVGSGFAGSMTTLNFLEECKKLGKNGTVALIEAGKDGERCGASRWTMAYLRLDKDNRFDDKWRDEMHLVSNGLADQEYCKKMEQEVPITARFLLDHGVKLNHYDEPNVLLEFNTNQHFVSPEGGGHAVINALFDHIRNFENVDIIWETMAERLLLTEAGEVCGVKVRRSDGKMADIHARRRVMLACGGFEGNKELLARYVGARTEHLELIAPGLKHNTGRGLQMALEVGAATAGSMSGMHCELVDTRAAKPDAVIWGHNYGIVVNEHCKRFFDEGKRHLFATFELVALETWRNQNSRAYFITDRLIMDRFRPGWVYETTDQEPEQSDTIEGLATKLGLDPRELRRTVDEFNSAVDKDTSFDLMKLDGKATAGLSPNKTNWANPIAAPPFYGYPLKPQLTFTYGGIKCDLESRVLATNEAPIPNLYCAGELSGLFYNEYPPASSVLRSLTFGRLAGTDAARAL